MAAHSYWGSVESDWAGFSAEKKIFIPGFEKEVTIFLGEEFNDEGEQAEDPPTDEQLNEYAQTFQQYLTGADAIIPSVKEASFGRYQKLYANYYENQNESGETPLSINNSEKHFTHMKDLSYIRVLDGATIKLSIHYKLDSEHGLELKLVDGAVADIGGIAET